MYNIEKFKPCREALEWYQNQSDEKTAWENCHRGDWMLWIACRLKVDNRIIILTKGHCANTVRDLMRDKRSRDAVDAAIAYGEGRISIDQLHAAADAAVVAAVAAANAADAAYAAAADADVNAAADAAYAAADATYAAATAADAAVAAADAAAYAAAAAAAADVNAAYAAYATAYAAENRKKTADICRKYLTEEIGKILKWPEGDISFKEWEK